MREKKEQLFQISTFLAGLLVHVFCQRAKSISCFYTGGHRERTEKEEGRAKKMTKIHGWPRSSSGRCAIFSSRVHWEKCLMGHHEYEQRGRVAARIYRAYTRSYPTIPRTRNPCCCKRDTSRIPKRNLDLCTSFLTGWLFECIRSKKWSGGATVYNKIYADSRISNFVLRPFFTTNFFSSSSHRPLNFAVVSLCLLNKQGVCGTYASKNSEILFLKRTKSERDNFYCFFWWWVFS